MIQIAEQIRIRGGSWRWVNDSFTATNLSVPLLARLTVVGIALVAISDVPQTAGPAFHVARLTIAALVGVAIFAPVRYSVPLLVMLLLAGRDSDSNLTASLWRLSIGPVRPSWVVFTFLVIQGYKARSEFRIPPFLRVLVLWFTIVPFVTGLFLSGLAGIHTTSEWITDLKLPMIVFGSFLVVRAFLLPSKSRIIVLTATVIAVLAARHLVDFFYLFAGYGSTFDGTLTGINRISEDSTKSGVVLIVLLGVLTASLFPKKFGIGFLIAVPATMLMIVYGTRMVWVEFALSVPLLLLLVRARKAPITILVIASVIALASIGVYATSQRTAEYVHSRFETITTGRPEGKFAVDVKYNVVSRVDPIRYAEAQNIFSTMSKRNSWLFGSGYGAYYDDAVVDFPPTIGSAFPEYSLETNRFYRAHNFVLHFFYKYGLTGIVLITSLWVIPAWSVIQLVRRQRLTSRLETVIVASIAAFMLTALLEGTWSGKGYFLNGVLIAITTHIALQARNKPSPFVRRWFGQSKRGK